MVKGYAVGIVSETKAFKQGIQSGVIAPLEDAQDELTALGRNRGADNASDSLDDVGDAARDAERRLGDAADAADDLGRTRGPDDLARALGDAERAADDLGTSDGPADLEQAMRDAQTATEKLGDETEIVARQIEQDFRDTYRKVKQDADDASVGGVEGFGKIKDGAGELQNEIGSNLGEAVSSFRGDLQDLGQVGQDTLGGLAATLASAGPAGMVGAAALAAGAAGLGLVTAEFERIAEEEEESRQRVAEWASAYIESAGKIVGAANIVAGVQAIATDPDKYKDAEDAAKDWGVTTSTAMLALAGDETALGIVTETLTRKQKRWGDVVKDTSTGSSNSWDKSNMTGKQRELGDEVARGTERLKKQRDEMSDGQRVAREMASALYDYATRAGKATDKTDSLGNAIYKLPDETEIVVDAKTKQAYEDIEALEKKAKDKKGKVTFGVDDSAVRNYKPKTKTGTVIYTAQAGTRQRV